MATTFEGFDDEVIKTFEYKIEREYEPKSNLQIYQVLRDHRGNVSSLCMMRDLLYCFSGEGGENSDHNIIKWKIQEEDNSLKHISTFEGHTNDVTSLSSFHSTDKFVSSSLDKSIKIWGMEPHQLIKDIKIHQMGVNQITLCFDDQWILSASNDSFAKLWDVQNDEEAYRFKHPMAVFAIEMLNDKTTLITGSGNEIYVWDIRSKDKISSIKGHDENISSIKRIHYQIITSSLDKSIKFWDIRKELSYLTIKNNSPIHCMSILNNQIVGGCGDGKLKIWNLMNGQEEDIFSGHTNSILSVMWMNEKMIASGSKDLILCKKV